MKAYTILFRTFTFVALVTFAVPSRAQQTWSALSTGLDTPGDPCWGYVNALTVHGGVLYAGGDMLLSSTRGIARWDGSAWQSVGGGVGGPDTPLVNALAGLGTDVYVGGDFSTAGGASGFPYVAKWNGTTGWSPLGATPGVGDVVYALAVRGGKVYVGGKFTTAGGASAARIAYWDTADSAWHTMGAGIADGIVYAIAITGDGTIYVGGSFSGALKKWNQTSWVTVSSAPSGTSPIVYALTPNGNDLYVGGQFTSVGASIAVRGLAKLSGSTWSKIVSPGQTTEPWNDAGAVVRAIAWNGGNQMYVAGSLGNSTPEPPSQINHLFAFVNGAWSLSIPSTPTLQRTSCVGDYGHALAVDRAAGKVYVGGFFDNAGGLNPPAVNVAVWNDLQLYNLSDFGTLSGGTYSYGTGLFTSVSYGLRPVAYSQVNVSGYGLRDHACYYLGGPYGLIDIGGIWGTADNSYANAGNDSDTIVGYSDYFGSGTLFRAFKWTSGSGFTTLNPFSGGDRGNALAINSGGDIVGFCKNGSGVDRTTRWASGFNSGEDWGALVQNDPTKASYAYGINKGGYIVGKSKTSGNIYHAYRTLPPNIIRQQDDLGTMGGTESIAYAINDSKQIVGAAQNNSSAWRAFLAAPDSTISTAVDLGPGYAYAINNYGQVVGNSGSYAFVWDSASGYKNLNNLIPAGSGFSLSAATAISDSGVIVGWGYKTIGGGYEIHGFRLDP